MTPDGCNTGGERVCPDEVQNSGSVHPHPEQIDPRNWCCRCGTHVATEGGQITPALCPVCEDDQRRATDRVRQHSHDRGERSTEAVVNDRALTAEAGALPSGGPVNRVMVSTDGQHWHPTNVIVPCPGFMTYTVT